MDAMAQQIDFLGVNYYTRGVISHDAERLPERTVRVPQEESPYTHVGWGVYPVALTKVLLWIKERYGRIPLYITENGAAFPDPPAAVGGEVDDPLRVDYLRRHISAVRDAIQQGADVRGYFAWSLLDNF